MIRRMLFIPVLLLPIWGTADPNAPTGAKYDPPLAKASDDARKAVAGFQRAANLNISVWAAEPLLAHPVAFAFDEKGRCFVAETFRHSHGTTDNRSHMNWLDDELALRTVDQRVALYRKDAGKRFTEQYETHRDRIRMVEDSRGTGSADRSITYRDDFGSAADGLGAGLLARRGSVYFTCIPDLWLLRDEKNNGPADVKKSLSTGYGVHTAFIGHDLHGLRLGPDGRLYFTCGDRGLNVTAVDGKRIIYPDSGAVLRCDPDGRNLELFATGLRNPQELAFDDFGNWFTVDNNSDSGDQARFIHLVEGGDSGWRIGYQYGSDYHDHTVKYGNRGPWNYELLWRPAKETRSAYTLPPLRNFADGPSGLTHDPGIGLPDKYRGYFFLADFRGSPGGSGIWAFTTRPNGATYEMVDPHHFVWNILATDCDFGPDSALYVSDWVDGWNINGKGRIYKVVDPKSAAVPAVAEAKKLLAEGFDHRSAADLGRLLAHPHRDVRLEAQFALAAKGADGRAVLTGIARAHDERKARVHAIWGLGMQIRHDPKLISMVVPYLEDRDAEVRIAAVRSMGEAVGASTKSLIARLADPDLRVRREAGLAIGRMTTSPADLDAVRTAVLKMLAENDDREAYLRHAGVMALARAGNDAFLRAQTSHPSTAVRIACVVALRRRGSADVAEYLADRVPAVVDESARAIHDGAIPAAMPQLAAMLRPSAAPATAYRSANARFVSGRPEDAAALADFAASADAFAPARAFALKLLARWPDPPRRDAVTGLTQSLPKRSAEPAASAFAKVIAAWEAAPEEVRREAVRTAVALQCGSAVPGIRRRLGDSKIAVDARVECLDALERLKDPQFDDALKSAAQSDQPKLRNAARKTRLVRDPVTAVREFRDVLTSGPIEERQGILDLLATQPNREAIPLIEEQCTAVLEGKAPPALALNVVECAAKYADRSPRMKELSARIREHQTKGTEYGKFRYSLAGGDAEKGRWIFLNHNGAACQRCHKLDGQGGEVGPPLNGLGKQTREYLLEAVILPNKAVAKGYDTIVVTTLDNKTVTGVLKAETADELQLMTAEAKLVIVKKSDIDDRRGTKSAMPEDLATKLNSREVRDLVEFLSGLKDEWKKK